jgi:arginase
MVTSALPVRVLGIPFDLNSSFLRGPAYAPMRIRLMETEGSANDYTEQGMCIKNGVAYHDAGDITFTHTDIPAAMETIFERVSLELEKGKVLSLGGDHSITYPIIMAHSIKHPALSILHIDAHGDLYHDFDGNSFSHASPFARIMENNLIKNLTQVGLRTLNPHQREQAARFGVKQIEMKDFTYEFVSALQGPLYISLDIDALDPAFAPGVSHHEPGGLTVREVLTILQKIGVEVVGADIVEYNPLRDHQNMTAMVAYKFMKELVGLMIR